MRTTVQAGVGGVFVVLSFAEALRSLCIGRWEQVLRPDDECARFPFLTLDRSWPEFAL